MSFFLRGREGRGRFPPPSVLPELSCAGDASANGLLFFSFFSPPPGFRRLKTCLTPRPLQPRLPSQPLPQPRKNSTSILGRSSIIWNSRFNDAPPLHSARSQKPGEKGLKRPLWRSTPDPWIDTRQEVQCRERIDEEKRKQPRSQSVFTDSPPDEREGAESHRRASRPLQLQSHEDLIRLVVCKYRLQERKENGAARGSFLWRFRALTAPSAHSAQLEVTYLMMGTVLTSTLTNPYPWLEIALPRGDETGKIGRVCADARCLLLII